MTTKTHITTGIAFTIPFINIHNFNLITLALIGSILPDIDMKLGIKHRGFTHSILCLICLCYGLFQRDYEVGFFFALGYVSHLLIDMTTVRGIQLFYPFNKRIGIKIFKTDGLFDHLTMGLGIIAICLKLVSII